MYARLWNSIEIKKPIYLCRHKMKKSVVLNVPGNQMGMPTGDVPVALIGTHSKHMENARAAVKYGKIPSVLPVLHGRLTPTGIPIYPASK
jgi:hypothetical protein